MIQKLAIKLLYNVVMGAINKKHNLKSMDDYVNKDNELDHKVRELENSNIILLKQNEIANKKINKYGKVIEELEKDYAMLKKDSHTPVKNLLKRIQWLEKKAR